MIRQDLAQAVYETCHLTGIFTLRSGKEANEYFDKYLFESNPTLLSSVAKHMASLIPEGTEILAGLEMGGIPLATAISIETGIPVVFVRKKAKAYGTCKLAEGISVAGKSVCIVEDVVTTGGQILLSAKDLREVGALVKDVICAIQREESATDTLLAGDLSIHPLFTMNDLLQSRSDHYTQGGNM
ncbi:orotate phosphoribosyltransferase [Alicyclobacillus fodiniaquatilis]|uniref:Orotate phosphoribosyltransferase n=1 Tax=Alicyclobacillus fodiniaquatilis TaxID=1661150 RepID=A0ABW4JIP0_9BACL